MRAYSNTDRAKDDLRSLVILAIGTGFSSGLSSSVVRTISNLADTAGKSPSGRRPRPGVLS
ncbi:MAG: hypothetical protein QF575_06700 [Acidimicrobiales bacterium]|mgnify:CR=1 FL=1|nr:hypothetical protein [Acidimicrobiales bacterium]